jgi:hypothetical protein
MGINVQLKSEAGDILGEVLDHDMTLSRAATSTFSGTRLLKYLTPWGDAIFNHLQAGDLALDIRDIRATRQAQKGTRLLELLGQIEPLVEELSRKSHVYLWFVGD